MRDPSISKQMLETLAYFAQGHMVYSDSIPPGLPNPDLFPILVERGLVQEVQINPNELYWYKDKPNRHSFYVISPVGKELFLLEQEIRDENAQRAAQQDAQDRSQRVQAVKDKKQEFRHNYSVAAFSELVSAGLPHFAPKLIDLVKTFIKSLISQ